MKKTLWRIFVGIEVFLVMLFLTFFAIGLIHNIKLNIDFIPSDTMNYLEALNDGSLQSKMEPYQTSIQAMLGFDTNINMILLPRDLAYSIDDEKYVIHRGEMIHVYYDEENGPLAYYGYGFQSYPTDKKGIRIAMPFNTASGIEDQSELYHIRLSELKRIYSEYYRENTFLSRFEQWLDLWIRNAKRETVLYWSDRLLYTEGIYLSKDLYWPLINIPLSITIGIFGIVVLLIRKKRKQI